MLTGYDLLPDSLERNIRQLSPYIQRLRDSVGEDPSPEMIEGVNIQIAELALAHRGFNRDRRGYEVTAFAVSLANEHLTGERGLRHVAMYVPGYFSHDYSVTQDHLQDGSNVHVLLGSMSPYSTYAHGVMVRDLFGQAARPLHLDVESVALTTLSDPSFQADVNDLPLSDGSITTFTTNNLFSYLGDDWAKLCACEEIYRTLQRSGAYMGIETMYNTALIQNILRGRGCHISIAGAYYYSDPSQETDYLLRRERNYFVETYDPLMYSIMAVKA